MALASSADYSAFYLDRRTICNLISRTLPYTIPKQLLLSEQEGAAIKHPVLFIQGDDDGPNVLVLLDYAANKVFLFGSFGRYQVDDTIYANWDSKKYWKPIAHEFKWTVDEEQPLVLQLDWVQVCMCHLTVIVCAQV